MLPATNGLCIKTNNNTVKYQTNKAGFRIFIWFYWFQKIICLDFEIKIRVEITKIGLTWSK